MPGIPGLLVVGRYRLDESIGQGGMGRVWRAADVMLDRPVAVKEMRMDDADAEDTRIRRERTLREARATARIDHPNVVRVYDVVEESDRLWIVMEFVESRSLERLLAEDGPLSRARPRASVSAWWRRCERFTRRECCTATSSPATCCGAGPAGWS